MNQGIRKLCLYLSLKFLAAKAKVETLVYVVLIIQFKETICIQRL